MGTLYSFGCTITLATRTPFPDRFILGSKILSFTVGFRTRAVLNTSCFAGTTTSSSKTTRRGSTMVQSNKHNGFVAPSGNFKTISAISTFSLLATSQSKPKIIQIPFHLPHKIHARNSYCDFHQIVHSRLFCPKSQWENY